MKQRSKLANLLRLATVLSVAALPVALSVRIVRFAGSSMTSSLLAAGSDVLAQPDLSEFSLAQASGSKREDAGPSGNDANSSSQDDSESSGSEEASVKEGEAPGPSGSSPFSRNSSRRRATRRKIFTGKTGTGPVLRSASQRRSKHGHGSRKHKEQPRTSTSSLITVRKPTRRPVPPPRTTSLASASEGNEGPPDFVPPPPPPGALPYSKLHPEVSGAQNGSEVPGAHSNAGSSKSEEETSSSSGGSGPQEKSSSE